MPSCPRVVLLIDENQQGHTDHVIQKLHLGCLRLLSYFAHAFHQHAGLRSSVLWGYKFYNSKKHETQCYYKQYPFLDYTTETFDTFEKSLYQRLSLQHSEENLNGKARPGEQLKIALTELLSDFQWDRPELFSPGKRKSKDIRVEHDIMNLLFIFTPCPTTKFYKNISYFGKDFDDSDSFMNLFLPPVLFEKLVKQSKVRIHWVDTSCSLNSEDFNVRYILDSGLRSVKGSLIPLDHLSQLWRIQYQNNTRDIGIISVTAILQGLLPATDGDCHKISSAVKICEFQHEGSSRLFYSQLWKNGDDVNIECIATGGKVSLCLISPELFSNQQKPLTYLICPNERKTKIIEDMKISIREKEAVLVTISYKNNTMVDGIMLPCTPMCGTIIVVNGKIKGNRKSLFNVNSEKLEKAELSNMNNISDEWFFYSSTLGFPLALKNSLKSLQVAGKLTNEREGNSKKLLEYFRKENKVEEDSCGMKRKQGMLGKRQRMQGLTWARWRLMEYKRKQEKKKINALVSESKTDVMERTADTSSIAFSNPVCIPEFVCSEDLEKFLVSEYSSLSEKNAVVPQSVSRIVQAAWNFFQKDSENPIEAFLDFMNNTVLSSVANIRDEASSQSRDSLVPMYLLQAQICLECLVFVTLAEKRKQLIEKVISFLRSVSFEENTFFLRNHLNAVILPSFTDRLADVLRHIYNEMMLDLPDGLQFNENDGADGDISSDVECDDEIQQILLPSSVSYNSSDNSSVTSSQTERRILRRHSSVVNENTGNRRLIAMAVKKKTKQKKKQEENGGFSYPHAPKTPKLKRRHSEMSIRTRVPDTPENKQINDLIWKKQERNRRHAKVDKKMKPIDESPVKEIKFPIKQRSLFTRSNSFGYRTSPRRFYTTNDRSATLHHLLDATIETSNKKLKRHATVATSMEMHGRYKASQNIRGVTSDDSLPSLAKRRSILFANFLKSPGKHDFSGTGETQTSVPDTFQDEEVLLESNRSRTITRRNIFQGEIPNATRIPFDLDGSSCCSSVRSHKRAHSPIEQESKKIRLSVNDNDYDEYDERDLNNENMYSKFKNNSEATVDWLTEIEQDQKNTTPTVLTFHDAFEKLKQTPTPKRCDVKDSPSIIKTKGEAITVSPCLSASSLEFLENAPIISPVLTKRKLRRRKDMDG